jgi:hypothetical protein
MTRIYIAGGMSGLPDLNFPAFHAAAAKLRAEGHDVVNPAEIDIPHPGDWLAAMRADIRELVTCDAIYCLDGWWNSRGARLERKIAEGLGLEVINAR